MEFRGREKWQKTGLSVENRVQYVCLYPVTKNLSEVRREMSEMNGPRTLSANKHSCKLFSSTGNVCDAKMQGCLRKVCTEVFVAEELVVSSHKVVTTSIIC